MSSFGYHELDLEKDQIEAIIARLEKRLDIQRSMLPAPGSETASTELNENIANLEAGLEKERSRLAELLQKMKGYPDRPEEAQFQKPIVQTWADLPDEAKSILEWTEHVWTGQRQVLVIERGKAFQRFGLNIPVTDHLFEEILLYLSSSKDLAYDIQGDTVKVVLKKKSAMAR